jgi:hypothetical protein
MNWKNKFRVIPIVSGVALALISLIYIKGSLFVYSQNQSTGNTSINDQGTYVTSQNTTLKQEVKDDMNNNTKDKYSDQNIKNKFLSMSNMTI